MLAIIGASLTESHLDELAGAFLWYIIGASLKADSHWSLNVA